MYSEKITILIIEDNPGDVRLIKEALAEGNGGAYNLKYADSLSDGLKKISEEDFDIVLLDLGLPDSTGLETITSFSEKNKDIPLIILTVTADLDVAKRALGIGAQDYLVKAQFDGASLSRSIRYAIERKKNEVELRKSESKYRSLFEDSIDGIYITTRRGKYVDVNTALVKMLGYKSKDELMSIDIKKELYISEDERPGPDKRNRIFETRLRKKDGSIMNAEISSKVISDNGKPKYYQGIVRDITGRKKAEVALKKAIREKDFIASAERIRIEKEIHDTLSQTIFSTNLLADSIPGLWKKDRQEALKQLEKIKLLTKESEYQFRRILLELKTDAFLFEDLGDLIRQLAYSLQFRTEIPVEVSIKGKHNHSKEVTEAFYRICQEALNNIIKYSYASMVKIELESQPEKTCLRIKDNGVGFDKKKISQKSLGLYIMRKRVKDINATLNIDSKIDRGTKITVKL